MMQGWKNCNGSCRICSNYCCPLRKESMQPSPTNEELTKDVQGMDINELKRKKRLLETKIDTLIATFLDENKDIRIQGVDVSIRQARNQATNDVVASHVETKITLIL
jgi:hypothetical protein